MESKEVMKDNKEPVNLPTEVQNLLNDYDKWEAEIEREEELKIRKKEMEKLENIDKERFRRFMNMNEQKIIINPANKSLRLVHILNEFFFHHKRSKGISNDIKSS